LYYRNDGKGHFIQDKEALPDLRYCGSKAVVLDMEGDGDLDLFVPSRLIPGDYPSKPKHALLMNDGKGYFTNKIEEFAPKLNQVGLITDAKWMDVEGDGKNELITVGEWMPVQAWQIKNNQLVPGKTIGKKGFWHCIEAFDANGDGLTDLIAGNKGLNTQLKAPVTLFYDDFDANGTKDPIMGYSYNNKLYPMASRDDLLSQLPGFKKRFITYEAYAKTSFDDLFTDKQRKNAQYYEVETLETQLFLNNGKGQFTIGKLPIEAQYSTVSAIISGDWNKDGNVDIILAGNDSYQRVKFGKMDANKGQVFLGNGNGTFRYLSQSKSNLNISGDTRIIYYLQNGAFIFLRNNDFPLFYKVNR
jgi:hypothetical protein